MKLCIKKIIIVFLIISLILPSVDISMSQVLANVLYDEQDTSNTAVESDENDLLKSVESDKQEGESEKSTEDKNEADVDVDSSDEKSTDAEEGTTSSSENSTGSDEKKTDSSKDSTDLDEEKTGSSENSTSSDEKTTDSSKTSTGSDDNSADSEEKSTTANENLNDPQKESEDSEETSNNAKESSNGENKANESEINLQDQPVGISLDEANSDEISENQENEKKSDDSEDQQEKKGNAQDRDFSWFYEKSKDNEESENDEKLENEVQYCSKEEINAKISEAEKNIVIKVNKNIKLEEAITFNNTKVECTLDIDGHTLTVEKNNRFIDVEKGANVTVLNGTLKGGNNTEIKIPPELDPLKDIQAVTEAIKKCNGVICCCGGTLTIDHLNIEENKSKSDGVVYVDDGKLILKNSNIKNNTAVNGGGINLKNNAKCTITDCIVEGNNQSSSSSFSGGTGIYVYNSSLTADGLNVISNGQHSETVCGGIFIQNDYKDNNGEKVELKNSLISDNYGCNSPSRACGAGMTIAGGNITLENTVIKNNTGYYCGGVGMYPASLGGIKFNMTDGAIYDNIASNTEDDVLANDIEIETVQSKTITVDIPKACEMKDEDGGEIEFSEFCWGCKEGETGYCKKQEDIKLNNEKSSNKYLYSATPKKDRYVAQINNEQYTSIVAAISAAKDGDIIKLIAGDNDRVGPTINEKVEIDESIDEETSSTKNAQELNKNGKKSITIDLNNKKWTGGNSMLNALTLENDNIDITIKGGGSISSIDLKKGSLTLDSNASISTICLADGKCVTAGEGFPTDKLESTISFKVEASSEGDSSEDQKEKLDEELGKKDIELIKETQNVSDNLLKNIKIENTDNTVIIKTDSEGNIVAHKLKAIYIDGANDKDNDEDIGLTKDKAVKTFDKVKEILKSQNDIEAIFVTGTVTVNDNKELSLPKNIPVYRYSEFTEYLINITKGNLTLENITIDGQGDKVVANSALIKVEQGATLNINKDTQLINNNHTKNSGSLYEAGGAVYCNGGTVNMNDGIISENKSWYGAGIHINGKNSKMNMNNGKISDNEATGNSHKTGGGGIAVTQGATLNMKNGEVVNNKTTGSASVGGGILIGETAYIETTTLPKSELFMSGGKVNGNSTVMDGGGIYIQCNCEGKITAGEISNNSCQGSIILTGGEGDYGGGGIYVNGSRNGFETGKLYISNAYIANNTSGGGSAIAGCGTSTVIIHPEGATIYKNSEGKKAEIYVDSTEEGGYGTNAKASISQYSTGGGINHWTDVDNGTELSYDELHNLQSGNTLEIKNTNAEELDTEGKLSTVKITGNTSERRGGGIGTNGYVEIGEKEIKTDIKVTKKWQDGKGNENKRPTSIEVKLYANDELNTTVSLTAENDWTYTFKDLQKYDYEKDKKITYTIEEEPVEGYTTKVDGYEITNIIPIDIPVIKIWNDGNNKYGKRPDKIKVHLLADGKEVKSHDITKKDDWKYTFKDMPKYDESGKEIQYTITEDKVTGYKSVIKEYEITNTLLTSVSGTKTWYDGNDKYGKRPKSIKVQLLANGEIIDTQNVTEANNWSYTFDDLPRFDENDKEITYTIDEAKVDNYIKKIDGYNLTNTYYIDITGTKTWEDKNDQDGKRPESITVYLLKNGKRANQQEVTADDGWAYSFTKLPKYNKNEEINYTIKEDKVADYTTEINGYDITNTHTPATMDITVTKTWDDKDNQDGKRPRKITVHLYANGQEVKVGEIIGTNENKWEYTFTGLPEYREGKKIIYTIQEDEVPDYTTEINGYNITNSHTPETTEIKGTKIWDDKDNQDGKRPEKITVTLYANGQEVQSKDISGTDENKWEYSFTGLPKYSKGHEIEYTVDESEVKDYTKKVEKYDITNSYTPETIDINGRKIWNDSEDQDGKRPESITVYLYDGDKEIDSKEVTVENGWEYSFIGLPRYRKGQKIQYTIKEDEVPNYKTEVNGYNITNTHTPETIDIKGTKTWNDNNNQDGKRPNKITIYLYAEDILVGSQEISGEETNEWEYSFANLPRYCDGQEIVYTVDESEVEGYTKNVDGYNITNTHTPETIEINGTKTWYDNEDQDGKRPEKITVHLFAGKDEIDSKDVKEAEGWTYSFEDLPKYSEGEEINYTIKEDKVAEYTTEINGYDITNTHIPETIEIKGTKTWEDKDNQDGKRPEKITVHLYADGQEVQSKEISGKDSNKWEYTFTGLPKYSEGKEINYTIKEDEVPDYTTEIDGYNITNTHTPETIEINGTKTWNDKDNQDGKRPDKIIINLLSNGEKVDSKEVTEKDEWKYTFTGLPKYSEGQEIKYTIDEEAVADYTKEIDGYNLINTHIPKDIDEDINTKPEAPKESPKTGDNILMNITVWLISIITVVVIIKKEIFNKNKIVGKH